MNAKTVSVYCFINKRNLNLAQIYSQVLNLAIYHICDQRAGNVRRALKNSKFQTDISEEIFPDQNENKQDNTMSLLRCLQIKMS